MTGWEARARNAWMWAGGGNEPKFGTDGPGKWKDVNLQCHETLLTG